MEPKKEKQNKPVPPATKTRLQACSQELAALLDKHGVNLVAVPTYQSDGRGGWYTVCVIQLAPRGS